MTDMDTTVERITLAEWAEIRTEADEAGSEIVERDEQPDGSTLYVLAVPIGGGWDLRSYKVVRGCRMTTHTSTEQTAQYIAGLDAAVEDARLAIREAIDDPTIYAVRMGRWRELRVLAREARLNAYGVPCPCCDGAMEVRTGRNPWDAQTCPVCKGDGRMLPGEAEGVPRWAEREDDDDNASENAGVSDVALARMRALADAAILARWQALPRYDDSGMQDIDI